MGFWRGGSASGARGLESHWLKLLKARTNASLSVTQPSSQLKCREHSARTRHALPGVLWPTLLRSQSGHNPGGGPGQTVSITLGMFR